MKTKQQLKAERKARDKKAGKDRYYATLLDFVCNLRDECEPGGEFTGRDDW